MPEARTCSECGAELPPDSPGGLCTPCALPVAPAARPEDRAGQSSRPTLRLDLPSEKPGERIGHYKLLESIGDGGMGTVWMAERVEDYRQRVALKVIKLGMDTKQVMARFEAERRALALMDHPNIAKVIDAGATDTGRPFFVMELVKGISITKYCDREQLSTRERLELFIQVCHAIQHAHQKGIIHRDIKPSNILVTLHDGVPVPKVIDFGIAKATLGRLTDDTLFTSFEQFIGTPAYMSPEQAELSGLDIDTRSDIYSLGVLLYELLTGKTPFDSKQLVEAGLDEIRRIIREVEPPRPSTRLSTLDAEEQTSVAKQRHAEPLKLLGLIRGDLDWIVMKCLEKTRARRYETANGLALDVQRFLSNEPILARPPSRLYRFQKLVRRHKLEFAASGAVFAALLVGLGFSTWLFLKEQEARRRASAEAKKSEQVAHFLKEMLGGVEPSVALGRDTTMLREILDKTAERVGNDLRDQPAVEAELRTTIGGVYEALGEYARAEAMHRAALVIQTNLFGAQHPDVAESLNRLASVLWRQNKLEPATQAARAGLAMRRKLFGNEHQDVAYSLTTLAIIVSDAGKSAEAERIHREALAMRRKLFGNEHVSVAASLTGLANVLGRLRKFAEAETCAREALDIRREVLGSKHPSVALAIGTLVMVLRQQGKLTEAEPFAREALAMRRELLGDNHPHVVLAINNLASALHGQGKIAEVEVLYREAVAITRKRFPDAHPDTALALNNLAGTLVARGQLAEAEALISEALAMRRKLFGGGHWSVASSLDALADVLHRQGRRAEAETLHRERLENLRARLSPNDPELARALANLARTLLAEGKFAEAETSCRESLSIREKKSSTDWQTFDARSLLGFSLLGQKQYAEAEPLLLSGYEGMEEHEQKIPREYKYLRRSALQRLVQLYEETNRPEKAAELKARLADFEKEQAMKQPAATGKEDSPQTP